MTVNDRQDVANFNKLPHTYDIYLPAFKPRAIDPQFIDADGRTKHVSEVDAHYETMLNEARTIQGQPYVARIYMAPQAREKLRTKMADVQQAWDAAMARERTEQSRTALKEALWSLGALAVSTSPNSIELIIGGRLPQQRSPHEIWDMI